MGDTGELSPQVAALLAETAATFTTLRQVQMRLHELTDALGVAGAAAETGHKSLPRLLEDVGHLDPRDARELVRHAALVVPGPVFSGEPIPPVLPATADAFTDGAISPEHVAVVARTLRAVARIPAVDAATVAVTEEQLAALARDESPAALARDAAAVLEMLDPDGAAPREPDRPDQELHLGTGRDGALCGRFRVSDPAAAQTLRTAIDALTPPPAPDDQPVLALATEADRRLDRARRQAQALLDLARDALGRDDLPDEGGEPVHLAVTVPLEVLREGLGVATLDGRWAVSAETARRLACDASVIPIVLGAHGEPLDIGRRTRIVPTGMRNALVERDRHCAHPGCHRRARRCHAHHVVPWARGGATRLDNLVLLCAYHHHLVHHGGWEIRIRDGVPEFLPPRWLDPQRRPRRHRVDQEVPSG